MSIMILLYVRRMINEHKRLGKVTAVKKIVLIAFFIELCSGFMNLIFIANWLPAVPPFYVNSSGDGIALDTITTGLTVTIGISFVFYLFNFERLFYTPFYAMLAIIFYYFVSGGHSELFPYYVYIGGVGALLLLYIASFRLHDNYAIGLAIFYTIAFLEVVLLMLGLDGNSIIVAVAEFCAYAFGIIYATGVFKPFKTAQQREKKMVEVSSTVETK